MVRFFNVFVAVCLVATGSFLFAATFGEQFDVPTFGGDVGPALAPRIFLGVWILLSALVLIGEFRTAHEPSSQINFRQFLAVLFIAIGTGVGMTKIGFLLAAIPGLFMFCWTLQYRRIVPLLLISLIAPFSIWMLFTFGFELLLPNSPWFHRL
ncbi:MAG: tripartite tricarboxylate transporter TctB family protein [Pseudomonadota bacterium]